MFKFRIEGAYDAGKLLDANWPTKAVTVIQRGALWEPRGPHHIVAIMSDVGSPDMSPDAPRRETIEAILEHTADLTDDDRLLVNCWLGQSRSAATMLGILIQHGFSAEDALTMVVEERPVAMPNVLITKHIDDIFGLNGELSNLVAAHIRSELVKAKIVPADKPTNADIEEMNRLRKLFD